MGVTYDGGETADQIRWGGDNHDMWADPKDPRRMMIGNDVGVLISTTRGRQWNATRLPIAQMYHVATDNRIPYFVYGQMQDDGSMRGPSVAPRRRRHLPGHVDLDGRLRDGMGDARPGRSRTSCGEAATRASSSASTRRRAWRAPSARGRSGRWGPTRARSSSA